MPLDYIWYNKKLENLEMKERAIEEKDDWMIFNVKNAVMFYLQQYRAKILEDPNPPMPDETGKVKQSTLNFKKVLQAVLSKRKRAQTMQSKRDTQNIFELLEHLHPPGQLVMSHGQFTELGQKANWNVKQVMSESARKLRLLEHVVINTFVPVYAPTLLSSISLLDESQDNFPIKCD